MLRVGGRLGWRGMVAGSALALTLAVAGAAAVPPAEAAPTGASTAAGSVMATGHAATAGHAAVTGHGAAATGAPACGKAVGPFRVSGTQVLDAGGKPFVSYGLTVAGLQGPDWDSFVAQDLQEIAATAKDWCANTVRLQVNQDDLLGPDGTSFDHAYMTAIESEVSLAESHNLVVVLNDETNIATPAEQAVQMGPTPETETFWQDLTNVYGNDPQVIFDLFNEPRMYSAGMPLAQMWQLWLNGGTFDGVDYPFGMAQLAAYVRTTLGAHNLFWIEGPRYSSTFAGMVQQQALLSVSNVVYAVHHPAGPADAASWDADFGYLDRTGLAPVVDGEWTNYEPPPTALATATPSSCWANAPTSVPQFLEYLAANGIGLSAYTLQPGYMIQSFSNLASPTTMNAATWSCQSNSEPDPGQGAGADVLAWFQQHNG
jgi:Cellulase (glycosyl hydrolase family 5)